MNNKFLVLSAALVTCISLTATVRADWESDVHMTGGSHEMTGKAHFKRPKMRLDINGGKMPMSMIVDWKAKHSLVLLHQTKSFMDSDMSRVQTQMVHCDTDDFDGCLTHEGFKKSGSETVNGHACTIYEKIETSPQGRKTHVKLWRATDIGELAIARTTNSDDAGKLVSQADFTNIKVVAQNDALFTAPKGYKAMSVPAAGQAAGGRPAIPMGADGKPDMAKIREMYMKKAQQGGAN